MLSNIIATIAAIAILPIRPSGVIQPSHLLASHNISLEDRQPNRFVNGVFKDNILLNIAYMNKRITNSSQISWQEIEYPSHSEFSLKPGESFAFHEDTLPEYGGRVTKTTNAHFNAREGFKSDGYLVGDGVCHLASLIYWAAKDAGLDSYAPANHNFAAIADIPREYGVAIYSYPGQKSQNAGENLYITNNHKNPVTFKFDYNGGDLKVSVYEEI